MIAARPGADEPDTQRARVGRSEVAAQGAVDPHQLDRPMWLSFTT
jgi:hypothetical protein